MCCQLSMTFVGNVVVVVVLTSLMVVDSSFWRERKGNLVVCWEYKIALCLFEVYLVDRQKGVTWMYLDAWVDETKVWRRVIDQDMSRSLWFTIVVVWEKEMGWFDGKNWRLDDGERVRETKVASKNGKVLSGNTLKSQSYEWVRVFPDWRESEWSLGGENVWVSFTHSMSYSFLHGR